MIGIDLSIARPVGFRTATGQAVRIWYAEAELTVVAAVDHYVRWRTFVGFAPVAQAVFGFTGGLQFFHTSLDYADGRFSLIPRADLPLTDRRFPDPAAAARS